MPTDLWAVNTGLIVISALALAANALLLLVFFRRRGLRTVSNRFVINLLATNFLSSVVLIPLLLVDQQLKQDHELEFVSNDLIIGNLNGSTSLSVGEIETVVENSTSATERTTIIDEIAVELVDFREIEEEGSEGNRSGDYHHLGNEYLCYISQGSTALVCTASILSILLIAIDQYFAVTHPLRYHTFIDKFKSMVLLGSTWFFSTIFGIAGSFVNTDSNFWNFCEIHRAKSDFQIGYNIFHALTYLILVILVPFLVICVIYGCIYCAAHRNSERMRKSNSGSSTTNLDSYVQIPLDDSKLKVKVNSSDNVYVDQQSCSDSELPKIPKVKSAPNFAHLEKPRQNSLPNIKAHEIVKVAHANSLRSNASFINSLKTKISNASLFRYREETRAAKISILVIIMVLVCYVPYGLALLRNTDLFAFPSPPRFNSLSLSLLVLANLLSPFLFAYRNRRIQRELRRLFGLLPGRKDFQSVRATRNSYRPKEMNEFAAHGPILQHVIPEVVVTCKMDNEKKSILKRVCSKGKTWGATKKCNFIPVPDSCLSVECRCSFSSASTQVSSEDYSASS